MNNPMRIALVTTLTLAAAACNRGKSETDRNVTGQGNQTEITSANVKAEADHAAKLKDEHYKERAELQKNFDAQDRKASYLKQKATHTVGTVKKNADAAIAEVDARRNTAKSSLSRLADDMSPSWDSTKKLVDDDIGSYGKAVDALENTLEKKK
jgi:uncharacterized protein YPO0396